MRRTILLSLLIVFAAMPIAAQSDFQTFWKTFRSAVLKNKKESVKAMMAPSFEWALDGYIPRDEAWRYFNEDRTNWTGLREAVTRKPSVCSNNFCNNRSGYHVWSSRKYRLEIMFERVNGSWKWSALLGD